MPSGKMRMFDNQHCANLVIEGNREPHEAIQPACVDAFFSLREATHVFTFLQSNR